MKKELAIFLLAWGVLGACSGKVDLGELNLSTPAAQSTRGEVTLSWDPQTINDGSSIATYRVRYGTSSGVYTHSADAGLATSYTVKNLTSGQTYYFTVTALNASGDQCAPSPELAKVAP